MMQPQKVDAMDKQHSQNQVVKLPSSRIGEGLGVGIKPHKFVETGRDLP